MPINAYDLAYAAGIVVAAPVWAARRSTRHKVLKALGQRMGHVPPKTWAGPAVVVHAVSVGEMNATAELVRQLLAARPGLHVVVSTTTDTGYDRGRQLYAGKNGVSVVRYPLDFTPAIGKFLDTINPAAVVLMEGELWPNFLLQCEVRKVPAVLVNGRVTPSAFKRYRQIGFVSRRMMNRLAVVCAQDEDYADKFRRLGAPPDRVRVTGTMKFDTARVDQPVPGTEELAAATGLTARPVWVCGSTGPGEESIILGLYRRLLSHFPTLRLVIVPRHPQRFEEVAELIQSSGCALFRRSTNRSAGDHPVVLGDTMGELKKFYALADVVFVGRSLVDLGHRQHGSDMIEPAALGKPAVIGPWTQNFNDVVRALLAGDGLRQVRSVAEMESIIDGWLSDPANAAAVGQRGRAVVRRQQGATARHVDLILQNIPA